MRTAGRTTLIGAGLVLALTATPATATAATAAAARGSQTAAASPVLQLGDTGAAVRAWQADLGAVQGGVVVDGVFGRRTQAATRAFQRAFGLPQDGVVRAATLTRMERLLASEAIAAEPVPAGAPQVLRPGSRGPAVRVWQGQLARALDVTLLVDGVYGSSTRAATATFQRREGLGVDGVAGPRTRTAMEAVLDR